MSGWYWREYYWLNRNTFHYADRRPLGRLASAWDALRFAIKVWRAP